MPEILEITQLILKHLPPSADLPNGYACDERSRCWVTALERQGHITLNERQAIDSVIASDMTFAVEAMMRLRPNGRAIFLLPNTAEAISETLVETLASAGFVRILMEAVLDNTYVLVRGERPTEYTSTINRMATIAQTVSNAIEPLEPKQAAEQYRFLYLLVQQHPPVRGWEQTAQTTWRAKTVRDAATDRVVLLAFTSLPKAVAFMQPAVLAGAIQNVNKLPRYDMDQFLKWGLPLIVNPTFERLSEDDHFEFQSPPLEVDPFRAMKSNES